MSEVDGKAAGACGYMLANGTGKSRARKDGTERKAAEWRLVFLSTGEVTLADKVREDGRRKSTAGQAVRVVDLPAEAGAGLGLFENLHGHPDGDSFARALREAAGACYGTPLRAFLERLTANQEESGRRAAAFIKSFVAEVCPPGADGQVKRVCGRFALVAAAGEEGIAAGVLPWPKGEAWAAAVKCFRAWLSSRGGIGAAEVQDGLEQVRAFFQAHGASRFEDLDTETPRPIINRAGYHRRTPEGGQFCVFPPVFKSEVCAGHNTALICRELVERGHLLPEAGRYTRSVRTPTGKVKLYVLDSSILGGDTGDTGDKPEITGINSVPARDFASGDTGDKPAPAACPRSAVPACPRSPLQHRGQEKPLDTKRVPTVPAVPTEKEVSRAEAGAEDGAGGFQEGMAI
jgi:uncharacterized protein (DUF927 family)